jgi:hypothetical protein
MDYRKIVKNLVSQAKGEADAGNEEAAQTFAEKAAALAVRHGVEDALTEIADEHISDKFIRKQMKFGNPYFLQRINLLNSIAKVLNCSVIRTSKYEADLFGEERDVERVVFLYRLLSAQMLEAVENARPTISTTQARGFGGNDKHWYFKAAGFTPAEVRSFRVSFLIGILNGISARMKEAYGEAVSRAKETNPGAGIVLADRRARTVALVEEYYPRTKKGSRSTARNAEGYAKGREASKSMDIGQVRITNRRALGA